MQRAFTKMSKSNLRTLGREEAENWWKSLPEDSLHELMGRLYDAIDAIVDTGGMDWKFVVDEYATQEEYTVVTLSYEHGNSHPFYDGYEDVDVNIHTYPRSLDGLKEKWEEHRNTERGSWAC